MKTILDFVENLESPRRSPVEITGVGRDDLAVFFREAGFRVGVELGVEQGLFTEVLAKSNPEAKIYAIDAWEAYRGYRDHVSQSKLSDFYLEANRRVRDLNVELVVAFSMDALEQFDDESLDFVYIDANHELPYVIRDIIEWSKKVRKGGVVSGHDYYESKRISTKNHVKYAVDCYTRSYRINPWFILGSKAKNDGEIRDKSRSWMWVKR